MNPDPRLVPPPGSIIDQSHPLAKDLLLCILHNTPSTTASLSVGMTNRAFPDTPYYYQSGAWLAGPNGWCRDYTGDHNVTAFTYDIIAPYDSRFNGITELTCAARAGFSGSGQYGRIISNANSAASGFTFATIASSPYATFLPFFTIGSPTGNYTTNCGGGVSLWPDVHTIAVTWMGGPRAALFYLDGACTLGSVTSAAGPTAGYVVNKAFWTAHLTGHKGTKSLECIWLWARSHAGVIDATTTVRSNAMEWLAAEPYCMFEWPGLKTYMFKRTVYPGFAHSGEDTGVDWGVLR